MLCAFMCSYSTLPMIGTGCGMPTDHFKRSGVIGNGASPKCGMPASLATVETATVWRRGGRAHDDVGLRLGDEASCIGGARSMPPFVEHDHLDRHAANFFRHEIKRIALGMPSAAAGPVVVTVMPMTISLDCAIAR